MQVNIVAGSQLVAYIDSNDAHDVQCTLANLLVHALGSKHTACLEVAKGCTVAYITFTEAALGIIDVILGGLARKWPGAVTFCYVEKPAGQSGYLELTGTGVRQLMSAVVVACITATTNGVYH